MKISAWAEFFVINLLHMNDEKSGGGEKSFKPEVVALTILLPLIVALGVIFFNFDRNKDSAPTEQAELQRGNTENNPKVELVKIEEGEGFVTVKIGDQDYLVDVFEETSVADLMQEVAGINIETKDFGGELGLFMQSINGVANDENNQIYWTLYVNGQRSPVGMSSAKVSAGDTVSWELENINE